MTSDEAVPDDSADDVDDEADADEIAASTLPTWAPWDARVEDALRTAEIGDDLRLVYNSSNYVFITHLDHPVLGAGTGIYKPRRGEQPLRDFPDGLYEREIAAFHLSRLLGWDVVPPTVERSGPHGVGSMQLFIEHDPAEHYFELRDRDREDLDEQFVRFAVFDLLTNNADRKGSHLLLDPADHLWGIDQGLCFHAHQKLRTVIWDYAGTRLPTSWLDDIQRVCTALEAAEPTVDATALRARIADRELTALLRRARAILDDPVLPEMYEDYRCVPWPMI